MADHKGGAPAPNPPPNQQQQQQKPRSGWSATRSRTSKLVKF